MALTLLPEALRILQQTTTLPDFLRLVISGASEILSLAFVSTADYSVLPSFLREFRETYPAVEFDLCEATIDMQIDGSDAGPHRRRPADSTAARKSRAQDQLSASAI